MRVSVNDQELFTLAQRKLALLADSIHSDILDTDLKRRLEWVLKNKVDQSYERFEKEWLPKLRADPLVESIPTSKQAFVELVIARANYKNRVERDAELQR